MTNIKPPLCLIDPQNLNHDDLYLIDVPYEMFPEKTIKLYKSKNYFIVWEDVFNKFKKTRVQYQNEFPLTSLTWFIDTIENKFWNHKPEAKALPGEVNEVNIIRDEKIGINPMRHCCAENLFGYSFWNASRKDYITELPPQSWEIPKYMLENGLMDQLKKISTDLGLKTYF